MWSQGSKRTIGLIPHNYFVSDINIFNKNSYFFIYIRFDTNVSVVNKRVGPRGTKSHWVYPLNLCVSHMMNFGDILCL